MEAIIAGIVLGFIGSFHCIGMCGPLVMALPWQGRSKVLSMLVYHGGRITAYSMIGALAGWIGAGFVMAGFQQVLSVTAGVLLMATLFFPLEGAVAGSRFGKWIRNILSEQFRKGPARSVLFIGFLNGFLPCGMVYTSMAGAAAAGSSASGILLMAAFGLGTVPVMLSLPLIGNLISTPFRSTIRKMTPWVIALMGTLLIFRGLDLGIPYLSPSVSSCHASAPPSKHGVIHCAPSTHSRH